MSLRRTRRPDSLAAHVSTVLEEMQCPVSTSAMRIVLNDRGCPATGEQLGRLAAYQREDYQRTRIPPRLAWALEPDGAATKPRWWACGSWRLQRRILTDDVKPIWLAHLAERLCRDLADRPNGAGAPMVTLTLGAAAQVLGSRHFDVPSDSTEWLALRREVHGLHIGAMGNLTGATEQQVEAEARLQAEGLTGFELLFGRSNSR